MSADELKKLPLTLRRKDALSALGCSKTLFYKLVGNGVFTPTPTPGGQIRVPRWQVFRQLSLDPEGNPVNTAPRAVS